MTIDERVSKGTHGIWADIAKAMVEYAENDIERDKRCQQLGRKNLTKIEAIIDKAYCAGVQDMMDAALKSYYDVENDMDVDTSIRNAAENLFKRASR